MKFFSLGKKKKSDDDRRAERRKGDVGAYNGPERRKGGDRRGLRAGLRFKINRALGPVEDWVELNFPGEHHLNIEEMSADFSEKYVRVVFATPEQRDIFKAFLRAYLQR